MKSTKIFIISSLIFMMGCAEPDSPQTAGGSSPNTSEKTTPTNPNVPAGTQEILAQKYDQLILNCRLDAKVKNISGGNGETVESQSTTASFNLLQSLNPLPLPLQLSLTNFDTNWQITPTFIQVKSVNFTSPTFSFEADRSPVIDAVFKGSVQKPTRPTIPNERTINFSTSNMTVQFFENANTVLVDSTEGPVQDPDLKIQVNCRLNATPKPQFANEFRRK